MPLGGRLPIVPADGRAGRSLLALIAALAFLAALAAGTAALVASRAAEWDASVARAATIQLRPVAGRDVEADLARAASLARATPGIAAARILDRRDAERLLEPWLGRGLDLAELPVPRLVALDLDRSASPDLAGLGTRLSAEIAGATLDDHSAGLRRLVRAARTVVGVSLGTVVLVLAASAGAVGFAIRGALAGHRDVVEVLHYAGADEGYVSRVFARRFAGLGLGGGLVGAAAAAAVLAAASSALPGILTSSEPEGAGAAWPYLACLAVALADGVVAAFVTIRTVRAVLRTVYRG